MFASSVTIHPVASDIVRPGRSQIINQFAAANGLRSFLPHLQLRLSVADQVPFSVDWNACILIFTSPLRLECSGGKVGKKRGRVGRKGGGIYIHRPRRWRAHRQCSGQAVSEDCEYPPRPQLKHLVISFLFVVKATRGDCGGGAGAGAGGGGLLQDCK